MTGRVSHSPAARLLSQYAAPRSSTHGSGGGGGSGNAGGVGGSAGGAGGPGMHRTPASSPCQHGDAFDLGHSTRSASPPVHCMPEKRIGPVPIPYSAQQSAATAPAKPRWRHTTCASSMSQSSSHTVDQVPSPSMISTRPSASV